MPLMLLPLRRAVEVGNERLTIALQQIARHIQKRNTFIRKLKFPIQFQSTH